MFSRVIERNQLHDMGIVCIGVSNFKMMISISITTNIAVTTLKFVKKMGAKI